jgi:hypothetical protein
VELHFDKRTVSAALPTELVHDASYATSDLLFFPHSIPIKLLLGSPVILLIIVLWSELTSPTTSKFIDG